MIQFRELSEVHREFKKERSLPLIQWNAKTLMQRFEKMTGKPTVSMKVL